MEVRANRLSSPYRRGASSALGAERRWRVEADLKDVRFAVEHPDVAFALLGQPLLSSIKGGGSYAGRVAGLHIEWQLLPQEEAPLGTRNVLFTALMGALLRRWTWKLHLDFQPADDSRIEVRATVASLSGLGRGPWLLGVRGVWQDALFAFLERLWEAAERLSRIPTEDELPALPDPEQQARLREHLQARGALPQALSVGVERAAGWMSLLELEDHVVVRFQTNLPRPRRGQEALSVDPQKGRELARAFRRLVEAGNAFTTIRGEEERRVLGRDLHARFSQLGQQLYQLYVPKETHGYLTSLLDAGPQSPLVLETGGVLRSLPWELLHNGEDFLALLLPLARTPIRAVQRHRERLSIRRVLLVVPESDLDEALDEVRAIHGVLSHDLALSVEVLSGEEATKEELLRALQSGRFDAFHFSGHSDAEATAGAGSLRLREGRKLRADELRRITGESGLQLVFLNSCESAAPGDVVGLADAFAGHGIPCVLGMRWPISDRGARILALSFYRALAEKGDPALALQEARLAVGSELDWEDPAWAAPLLYLT